MSRKSVPVTGRKVRFAVAGCGRISKNHFDAIVKHADRSELVAICDTDRDVLEATATCDVRVVRPRYLFSAATSSASLRARTFLKTRIPTNNTTRKIVIP